MGIVRDTPSASLATAGSAASASRPSWPAWVVNLRAGLIPYRTILTLLVYGGVAAVALVAALALRFEFSIPTPFDRMIITALPLLVGIRMLCAGFFNLSRGRWRFVGPRDVRRLVAAVFMGSLLFVASIVMLPVVPQIPRSVLILEPILTVLLTCGAWLGYRTAFEILNFRRMRHEAAVRRVLIVGAGEAGYMLACEMLRIPSGYRPIGFIDDNPTKWGTRLNALEVIGATADLPAIAADRHAAELVIAIPTATPAQLRRITERCEATGLPFRVLPGIREVLDGRVHLGQLREVRVEDLLGRDPIQLELPELAADLEGRSVLVTGAAGSIGSELVRQIALHRPRTLVLFDQAESALYYLELELRERHPDLNLVPVIGDIVDPGAVDAVFEKYRPDRVFHAAAFKHVPMMESNAREAIRNNVIGTWRVADAAGRSGAQKFILVSTDKAVRPVSVMGATKRMAELVILELQQVYQKTAFSAVRFGNVLGSNGSVVPIFKRQLQAGKPLTVTHPDATRYFMTIPEAVQLVLQSSILPEIRGHIAMLEMGEPVRIVDLARNLLRLAGRHGSQEDALVFTGLRPGERLHEELTAPDEQTFTTAIPKVRLVETPGTRELALLERLADWSRAMDLGDNAVVVAEFGALFAGLRMHMPAPEGHGRALRVVSQTPDRTTRAAVTESHSAAN